MHPAKVLEHRAELYALRAICLLLDGERTFEAALCLVIILLRLIQPPQIDKREGRQRVIRAQRLFTHFKESFGEGEGVIELSVVIEPDYLVTERGSLRRIALGR